MDQVGKVVGNVRIISILLAHQLLGLLEWFIPVRYYAKPVDQDIVLITGGGSGLGRAIALEYAKLNSSLVLWDINEKGLQETKNLVDEVYAKLSKDCGKEEIKRSCTIYNVDVSDKQQVSKMAAQVSLDLNKKRKFDEPERYVSVLVNNAGIYHGLMLQELRDDQIERIFKINILAHFWTVRAFLPNMIKHEKGHIVEIASMGGISGMLKQVDYCATKYATVGFEESLSIELSHMGLQDKIRTTVICPFFFSSNLFTGFDTSVGALMSPEFVAEETVQAMRCNHSRVMLPKWDAYLLYVARTFMTRKTIIDYCRMFYADGVKEIKGKAASEQATES